MRSLTYNLRRVCNKQSKSNRKEFLRPNIPVIRRYDKHASDTVLDIPGISKFIAIFSTNDSER